MDFSTVLKLSAGTILSLSSLFAAEIAAPVTSCSSERTTLPARVDFQNLKKDFLALKDDKGRPMIAAMVPELESGLRKLFEADPSKISKLEQFYGLLYLIGRYKIIDERKIILSAAEAKKILISSKVFSTPELPSHITQIVLYWSDYMKRASYEVFFDKPEVRLDLNGGKGFANYSEGMCQVAKALIFYGQFSFDIELARATTNVYVTNFRNVDLFGEFGSRGAVKVDIQYVSLKSVEFLSGSPMGTVRAKVSKKEFEINDHSWILKLVATLVTDKSTQPIDW